jgi:hypothetical protein
VSVSTEPEDGHKPISNETVATFLSENPDFFIYHEDVLAQIRIPHPSGQAISLLERQVQVLRDQLGSCSGQLQELLEVARDNESLTDRMHKLTLALMDTHTFEEMICALQDALYDYFQADAVELRLFSSGELDFEPSDSHSEKQNILIRLKSFLDQGKPLCGPLDQAQLKYIFGPLSDTIHSTAIVPVQSRDATGILAIGSRSKERFNSNKGTLFLTRLGELLSHTLQKMSLPGI